MIIMIWFSGLYYFRYMLLDCSGWVRRYINIVIVIC